jgi:hypothetical protein
MATDTFVNILDLQPITEVVNGDYLIVETPAGTRIINFKDFILPNSNILIAQTVSDNTTAILSNFTVLNDYIAALSASITSNVTLLSSVSSTLQTQTADLSSKLYVGTASITITQGGFTGVGALSPATTKTIPAQNISITPANAYAALNAAYVTNTQANGVITITAPFSGAGTAASDAIYNILVVSNS